MNTVERASNRYTGKHIVIVHGYTASPDANWFPWLAEVLRAEGARVSIPAMPDSLNPDPVKWASTLQQSLPAADTDTILVGHSLGCIAVLRHLLSLPAHTQARGVLLVSGFDRTVSTLPELRSFTDAPLDHAEICRRAQKIISLFSDNDSIVEPAASIELSRNLNAEQEVVSGGGHFLEHEGFEQFPEAYTAIAKLLAHKAPA
ncbi:serine hydrolase family protein [Burkholderia sp. Bp8963]|uniref:RBBP9/YdeN family alpha/beta hydrolase n=1 Tax=Burkholderia sp. Bp8963 TaxID=2184547 RepID=UPI000F5A3C6A|nr:alpha/beta fold hydrolase [Burkholderia sp. Bp8963]RQS66480.1 serine hydrolase family protein [Burkholderia sp. Bp8963]